MDEIAKRAKVSKGNIYWHFKSKMEIFTELVKEEVRKIHSLIEREGDSSLPLAKLWKQQIEKGLSLIGGLEKQLKVFYEVAFSAWKIKDAREFFLELDRELTEEHRKTLERSLKERNLSIPPSDLNRISKLFNMLHHAIIFRILLLRENEDLWEELKETAFAFIDMLSFYIYKGRDENVSEGI